MTESKCRHPDCARRFACRRAPATARARVRHRGGHARAASGNSRTSIAGVAGRSFIAVVSGTRRRRMAEPMGRHEDAARRQAALPRGRAAGAEGRRSRTVTEGARGAAGEAAAREADAGREAPASRDARWVGTAKNVEATLAEARTASDRRGERRRHCAICITGMPSCRALSTRLPVMPLPGKAMTPLGSRLRRSSLRRKGAALP